MKSLYFFLFVMSFINIETKNISKEILFDNCNKDSWWIKNISLTPSDSLINFEANITRGEKNINSTLVKFTLTGCNSNFTCLNHTNLAVKDFNCTNNSTDVEKELCSVLKVIEEWTKNSTYLMTLNDNKKKQVCVSYEFKEIKTRSNLKNTLKDLLISKSFISNETLIKLLNETM